MSLKVTLLFSFISFFSINAQKLELGKVTIAELEETQHPIEKDAPAAILFEKGKVTFEYSQSENGFIMLTKVQIKIKVYKKEGYSWANKSVRYFIPSNFREDVRFDDAVTYNLVGGKIEKTKLKSDGEFDEKINKFFSQKKIAMPNVKEGSIIEYEYTIKSPNIVELKDWSFQKSIPVNYSEFVTNIPEYFVYKPTQKGFVFPKSSIEKKYSSITFTTKDKPLFGHHSTNSDKIEFEETQTTYSAQNLPSMKEEAYVNNIDNYTSSVSHELTLTRFPNTPYKTYATDWETVTKKIYDNDDFGPELNKIGYFEQDINTLISGLTTRDEKIATIFSFVKSKVKWNNYYGYSCDDGVKKAYKDNVGNVAEINLMLTAMLRYAGIDANPVLLSTRSNGIALFPNRTAFNYVISAVEIQDGLILLDATEKFSTPNILPLRDLNWFGRLIRKDGTSIEVQLTPTNNSTEVSNIQVILDKKGGMTGKIRKQYQSHNALNFRQKYVTQNNETYIEEQENRYGAIQISDYVRENDLDLSKPITETFSFSDSNATEIINDKIYVSPLFFLSLKENPFKQEKREYPIDFGFPFENSYNINIEIPEGYSIESIPEQVKYVTDENMSIFTYLISNVGNRVQLKISNAINTAIVPSDSYSTLKDFYQKVIDKQNEKIVLKKI